MNIEAKRHGVVMHSCPLTRCGLLHLLNTQLPDFTFQASGSFNEMRRSCDPTKSDLVVSDINDDQENSPYEVDWLLWLQQVRGDKPLIVVADELANSQWRALAGQPSISLLALQTSEKVLIQQLHQALLGKQVISPLLSHQPTLPAASYTLTKAELQVLALLHAGYNVTQIAVRLNRSIKTISTHKRYMMHKLRVNNEIALFSKVSHLNESVCVLDNGQQFVNPRPPSVR